MKIYLLSFLLFVVTTMSAESIIIKQKSGNETIFDLSTNPVITFSGENMVVTNDFISITMPIDDIDDYVVNSTAEIQEMADTHQYYDGHIVFKGNKRGTSAFVYSLDGKKVGQTASNDDGLIEVNMGNYPKGTYIISTPNNRIKVINK